MKVIENRKRKESTGEYTQYKVNADSYYPTTKTINEIPAGFYKPSIDGYTGEVYLQKKTIITPKLYLLPNDAKNIIVDDIDRFWQSEDKYRNFQSVYKRNILIYSIPGNGKTCLINIMCNELIEKYNGVVICIDTYKELDYYSKVMGKFRQIEPYRKVITIIEDFEKLAKDNYYSSLLLQLLDGNEQLDNIVTIATTNYPENLEKRWTCRPSRFNIVMEYKKPNVNVREFYIYNKLKDGGIDVNSDSVKKDIKRYVEKTEGFTFDFLKELIQGIYVDGLTEEETFKRIETARSHNGSYRVTEDDGRKIGFHDEDQCCEGYDEETKCNPIYAEDYEIQNDMEDIINKIKPLHSI